MKADSTRAALEELQRRSRKTLTIVSVGMLVVIASLLALAYRLNVARSKAQTALEHQNGALALAKAAVDDPRNPALRAALQLANESAGSTKPAQIPLRQLEVRVWVCDGSPARNQADAKALLGMRPADATGRWTPSSLSAQANARWNYRLVRNEIRYNPEEEDAADQLLRMIRGTGGSDAAKVLTFFPTPNSVSVFFCQGAQLPPTPPR